MTIKKHFFISYARENSDFKQQLLKDLEDSGIPIWSDQNLVVGTPDWDNALREAIRAAYGVILIASPDAYQSRFVRGELYIAQMYDLTIYPVWAAGDSWQECVPLDLIPAQYEDMKPHESNYAEGLTNLTGALQKIRAAYHAPAVDKSLPPDFKPRNPYKGLHHFTNSQQDVADFYGRDDLVATLIEELSLFNRFLTIVGASGSGKSSVFLAGLLPCLKEGAIEGSDTWHYLERVRPGPYPLRSLVEVLSPYLDIPVQAIQRQLEETPFALHTFGQQIASENERVVLFIDQFEELFTQVDSDVQRSHVIDLLTTTIQQPDSPWTIVVALRADFYHYPMNYPGFGKLVEKHNKSVVMMDVAALRHIIEAPARQADVRLTFEENLVGDILLEIHDYKGNLPLLQFTLDQLMRHVFPNTLLTRTAYETIGGVRGAIAKHADRIYDILPADRHRELAQVLFLRLIEPGANPEDATRRRTPPAELDLVYDKPLLDEVIEYFVGARLLTADRDSLEIIHEALLSEWERLADWIQLTHDDLRFKQRISRDAAEWLQRGQPDDELYRGEKLQQAQAWRERNEISQDEAFFIDASAQSETKRIASRQRDKELQEQLNTIFNESLDVIAIIGEDERITQVNRTVEEMLGYTPDELTGEHFSILFLLPDEKEKQLAHSMKDKPYETVSVVRKDGSICLVELTATIIPLQGELAIMMTLRNVSLREQLRSTLTRTQQKVMDIERERALMRAREDIIFVIAHQIRNPMAVIRLSADFLQRYFPRLNTKKRNEHLDRILSQSAYLKKMMENMLTAREALTGSLQAEPEAVNIGEICRPVFEQIRLAQGTPEHTFIYEDHTHTPFAMLDETLLISVVENLMENAVKFSPEGGEVRMTLNEADGEYIITVSDEGIGIPADFQNEIFGMFQRADNVRGIRGTGIGLGLVYNAIEAHGGHIRFTSTEGEGSTFVVTIPIVRPDEYND